MAAIKNRRSNSPPEISRRRWLQVSSIGWLEASVGLSFGRRASDVGGASDVAQTNLVVFHFGGPSQFETYDPKPADCYSVVLAGGGLRGGAVYGASDKIGAYPDRDPVSSADLAATIFWRFGIDPSLEVRDPTNRPFRLSDGQPLTPLFGQMRA